MLQFLKVKDFLLPLIKINPRTQAYHLAMKLLLRLYVKIFCQVKYSGFVSYSEISFHSIVHKARIQTDLIANDLFGRKKTNLQLPLVHCLTCINLYVLQTRGGGGQTVLTTASPTPPSTKPGSSGFSINAYKHFSPFSCGIPKHWLRPSWFSRRFPIPARLGLALVKRNLVAQ